MKVSNVKLQYHDCKHKLTVPNKTLIEVNREVSIQLQRRSILNNYEKERIMIYEQMQVMPSNRHIFMRNVIPVEQSEHSL